MSGIKKMYTFYTELTSTEANATPTLMSGDAGIKFAVFLTNESKPVSLANIKRLHASFTKPNSPTPYVQGLETGVSIQDAERGIIAIDVDAAAFSGSAGIVQLDLMLYDETQESPVISVTGRIQLNVRLPIENNASMIKNPQIPLLIGLQEDLEEALKKQDGQIDETRIAINEANTMAQYASDQGDYAKFHGEAAQFGEAAREEAEKGRVEAEQEREAAEGKRQETWREADALLEGLDATAKSVGYEQNASVVFDKDRYLLDFSIPRAKDGTTASILGMYDTVEELIAAHPVGSPRDAYAVGTAQNNVIYAWDYDHGRWQLLGLLFLYGCIDGGVFGDPVTLHDIDPIAHRNLIVDANVKESTQSGAQDGTLETHGKNALAHANMEIDGGKF